MDACQETRGGRRSPIPGAAARLLEEPYQLPGVDILWRRAWHGTALFQRHGYDLLEELAAGRVIDADLAVVAAGGHAGAVGTQGDGVDRGRHREQAGQTLAVGETVDAHLGGRTG